MILDTSAVIAILLKEPHFERLLEKFLSASHVGIGAPTLTETSIVLSARLGRDARGDLARFLLEASVAIVPYGDVHHAVAIDAWLRFGKGRHPAGLNLGDCMSYASAKVARQPLLCVGKDFAKTDLTLA